MLLLCHHRDELIFGLKYEGGGGGAERTCRVTRRQQRGRRGEGRTHSARGDVCVTGSGALNPEPIFSHLDDDRAGQRRLRRDRDSAGGGVPWIRG